jgi:hypothetical protein
LRPLCSINAATDRVASYSAGRSRHPELSTSAPVRSLRRATFVPLGRAFLRSERRLEGGGILLEARLPMSRHLRWLAAHPPAPRPAKIVALEARRRGVVSCGAHRRSGRLSRVSSSGGTPENARSTRIGLPSGDVGHQQRRVAAVCDATNPIPPGPQVSCERANDPEPERPGHGRGHFSSFDRRSGALIADSATHDTSPSRL